jgi:hypothetical protein
MENCKVSYYIFGNVSLNKKEVKFFLEADINLFDLSLNAFQLNDFLSAISDIVIACLCLNPIEKNMIIVTITKPLEDLINYQNYGNAKNYLINIHEENTCITLIDNLSTVLVHYNYIVIILHKLQSLVNEDLIIEKNQNIIFQQ